MRARASKVLVTASLALVVACAVLLTSRARRVHCEAMTHVVAADGRAHPVARLRRRLGAAPASDEISVAGENASRVSFVSSSDGATTILYRAPVSGGSTLLRIRSATRSWGLPVHAVVTWSDRAGDGTPDFLRLHDAADRQRFRAWFTALADRAAAVPDASLPSEITDCSALLRYSYRIALMRHDDRWYKQYAPGAMPTLPSVEQWNYPETPLGAGLFRIAPATGALPQASDFAEFADAKTLYSRNSFRIGRDVRAARPGDLLFFHQLEGEQQYHSMIVTGEDGGWVVYHTGPETSATSNSRGEMRRVQIAELLQHPDPRWHPTTNNPNFLGVFRWNILRED